MNHHSRRAERNQSSYHGAVSCWQVDLEGAGAWIGRAQRFDCENNLLRRAGLFGYGRCLLRPRPEPYIYYAVKGSN